MLILLFKALLPYSIVVVLVTNIFMKATIGSARFGLIWIQFNYYLQHCKINFPISHLIEHIRNKNTVSIYLFCRKFRYAFKACPRQNFAFMPVFY